MEYMEIGIYCMKRYFEFQNNILNIVILLVYLQEL